MPATLFHVSALWYRYLACGLLPKQKAINPESNLPYKDAMTHVSSKPITAAHISALLMLIHAFRVTGLNLTN